MKKTDANCCDKASGDASDRPRVPAPGAPDQQGRRRQRHREHDRIDRAPAKAGEQLARGERADGHGAEHQEVVERLHLIAFIRAVAGHHHGAGADEGEVPPDSEQCQRRPEMPERKPRHADDGRGDDQGEPEPGDARDPEAGDERARDEARGVHAEHVPLDAQRRVGDGMVAHDHRQRRRRHHHVHHGVSGDAAGDRHDEARLLGDLHEWPTIARDGTRRRLRDVQQHQHAAGRQSQQRLADIARREQIGRPHVFGQDHELRADDAGKDAADQDPRDCLRPEGLARGVRGREAVGIVRCRVESAEDRADVEDEERALEHGRAADHPGEHAAGGADLQCVAPPESACERAERQRAEPEAKDEDADRQGRKPLVGREHRADDAGCGHQHGVVAAGQRLGHRQNKRVAPGEAIAGIHIPDRPGERRHPRSPCEETNRREFFLAARA